MAVLKNKTQGQFVIINIEVFRDGELSVKERGLLCTLLSLPDNWDFTIRGLARILPDGKAALGNILQTLEEKGYLYREQSRCEGGEYSRNVIEVFDHPEKTGENRDTDNRDTVNRDTEKRTQYNNYKDNIQGMLESIHQSDGDGMEVPVDADELDRRIMAMDEGEDSSRSLGMTNKSAVGMTSKSAVGMAGERADKIGESSVEVYEAVRASVMERIDYGVLVHDYPEKVDLIDLIVEILVAVENNEQESMRVGGELKPVEVVRAQMQKLSMFHVQYVLDGLESAGRIRNPTAYMLTSLYRSVLTMQMHVDNQFQCDCRGIE